MNTLLLPKKVRRVIWNSDHIVVPNIPPFNADSYSDFPLAFFRCSNANVEFFAFAYFAIFYGSLSSSTNKFLTVCNHTSSEEVCPTLQIVLGTFGTSGTYHPRPEEKDSLTLDKQVTTGLEMYHIPRIKPAIACLNKHMTKVLELCNGRAEQ